MKRCRQRRLSASAYLAAVVAGQDDDRHVVRRDRAELGDADLKVAQDLEQECLNSLSDLSISSTSRTTGSLRGDRAQQRARQDEALGEEHAVLRRDRSIASRSVPVPARSRRSCPSGSGCRAAACRTPTRTAPWLLEALVALQTDQLRPEAPRQHLGELGLADAGGPSTRMGLPMRAAR